MIRSVVTIHVLLDRDDISSFVQIDKLDTDTFKPWWNKGIYLATLYFPKFPFVSYNYTVISNIFCLISFLISFSFTKCTVLYFCPPWIDQYPGKVPLIPFYSLPGNPLLNKPHLKTLCAVWRWYQNPFPCLNQWDVHY